MPKSTTLLSHISSGNKAKVRSMLTGCGGREKAKLLADSDGALLAAIQSENSQMVHFIVKQIQSCTTSEDAKLRKMLTESGSELLLMAYRNKESLQHVYDLIVATCTEKQFSHIMSRTAPAFGNIASMVAIRLGELDKETADTGTAAEDTSIADCLHQDDDKSDDAEHS